MLHLRGVRAVSDLDWPERCERGVVWTVDMNCIYHRGIFDIQVRVVLLQEDACIHGLLCWAKWHLRVPRYQVSHNDRHATSSTNIPFISCCYERGNRNRLQHLVNYMLVKTMSSEPFYHQPLRHDFVFVIRNRMRDWGMHVEWLWLVRHNSGYEVSIIIQELKTGQLLQRGSLLLPHAMMRNSFLFGAFPLWLVANSGWDDIQPLVHSAQRAPDMRLARHKRCLVYILRTPRVKLWKASSWITQRCTYHI